MAKVEPRLDISHFTQLSLASDSVAPESSPALKKLEKDFEHTLQEEGIDGLKTFVGDFMKECVRSSKHVLTKAAGKKEQNGMLLSIVESFEKEIGKLYESVLEQFIYESRDPGGYSHKAAEILTLHCDQLHDLAAQAVEFITPLF